MKRLKEFNKSLSEFESLDEDTKELLVEISIGKISTTILVGRLMRLVKGIKDRNLQKSLSTLGYMIYTVSLQSKSLQQVDKKLDNIIRKQEQNELDFRRIKTKLKL
jgi:hypothetical protein